MQVLEQAAVLDGVLLSVQEIPGARVQHRLSSFPHHHCIFQTSNVSTAFKIFQRLLEGEHLHTVQLLNCS